MKISFLSVFFILVVIITLFLYYSINVSPSVYWGFAFFPLLIPVFIFFIFIFLIYWIFRRKVFFCLLSLVLLALGYKFFIRTYAFNEALGEGEFSVLNYNVRVFNSYEHLMDKGYKSSKKMIQWISDHNADVKCLQEVYNNGSSDIFNSINKIRKNNPYVYYDPYYTRGPHTFGLAIFSKYRIVNKGELKFQKGTFNQAIFADIKYKDDTVRVYNIHLQSMSINEDGLYFPDSGTSSGNNVIEVFRKLKRGSILRSKQVKILLDHIKTCSYKVIVCGDLNDTPYSYTYEMFRKKLYNAFEEKGSGFGFTHNGKLGFLRIDNIFSDKSIEVNTFKTHKNITYSDHCPIEATYTFK